MKYILLFFEPAAGLPGDEAAVAAMYDTIGRWWGEHVAAGRIVGGEQLQPAGTATTVRFDTGSPVLSDGPMLEAKEVVGGFALVDVADLDQALEMARSWPARQTVEVRPLVPDH